MDPNIFSHALTVFLVFFAIMNPIANTPIFLSLTRDTDRPTQKAMAFQAVAVAFAVVAVFTLAGQYILQFFGITLTAFRLTGGILVFVVGNQLLHGGTSNAQTPTEEDSEASLQAKLSVAICPLAMPILAGPGTIATAMHFVARGTWAHMSMTLGAFAAVCLLTYILFLYGERLTSHLGQGALNVITRMMGLIVAVIGVQMLLEGISGAILHFQSAPKLP